jgi:hypothetical protein
MSALNQKRKNLLILNNKHIAITIFILTVLFLTVSCSRKPDGVLNKSEMTNFLVDLHKLDGTLAVKGLGSAQDRENLYYYNALLTKYGITEAQFDSSLAWYSKDPKTFEKIYIKVTDKLNKLDSLQKVENKELERLQSYQEISYNLWNNPTTLVFNQDSIKGLHFVIKNQSFYEKDLFKFIMQIRSSGKIKNQYVLIRLHYHDGVRDSIKAKVYTDSILRKYTIKIRAKRKENIDSISGIICKTTDKGVLFKTKVDSISLLRVFVPAVQDSIVQLNNRKASVEIPDSIMRKRPTPRVRVLEFRKNPLLQPAVSPYFQ